MATDSEDRIDEWFIISEDIPSKSKEYNSGSGFVLKSDIKVTRKERQVPQKVNNSEVKQQGETDGT